MRKYPVVALFGRIVFGFLVAVAMVLVYSSAGNGPHLDDCFRLRYGLCRSAHCCLWIMVGKTGSVVFLESDRSSAYVTSPEDDREENLRDV
ncbi:hypothetical protein CSUI_011165 [Cystoisospora suis]|uniref:Transmembrane protein n=1 Tax=Cystoisospora suis TaxID=483139 RepID=A0A2C6KF73_9APIC|nr:hypothetical protein CSUI_011165 [Cystoisospora suis]